MKSCTWLLVAGLVVWALSTGQAWGNTVNDNIVNGDFATGNLTGWFGTALSLPSGDPVEASVGVVGEQLQLQVSKSYVFGSGVSFLYSYADVTQDVFEAKGFPPPDTVALQFDADIEITGAPNANAFAVARVDVAYNFLNEYWYSDESTDGVQPITIYLPGLDVFGPPWLEVRVSAICQPLNLDSGTNYDIAVDAKFDNFRFTSGGVIPEPLTIFSALMGVGGLGAYIRRRNASGA